MKQPISTRSAMMRRSTGAAVAKEEMCIRDRVTALRKSGDAVTGVEGLLSGEPFRLTSRLGVVLAGGGFSRNMEMMRLYAPGLSDVLPALSLIHI